MVRLAQVLLATMLFSAFGLSTGNALAASLPAGVTLIEEGPSGFTLLYEPPRPSLSRDRDPAGRARVVVSGHESRELSGEPDIPAVYFWFGMPSGGEPRLITRSITATPMGRVDLAPVPTLVGTFESYHEEFTTDPTIWGASAPFPPEPLVLSGAHTIATQRVGALVLFPARWNPSSGELEWLERVTARVEFDAPSAARAAGAPRYRERMEAKLSAQLVNYESAKAFRDPPPAPKAASRGPGDSFVSSADWMRVDVRDQGIYRITHADLVAAGIDDPAAELGATSGLRLYNGGVIDLPERILAQRPQWMRQIPLLVRDGGDGSFDAGDELVFYALGVSGFPDQFDPAAESDEHFDSRFVNENVYWLTWGGDFAEAPARMVPGLDGQLDPDQPAFTPVQFIQRDHYERDIKDDYSRVGEDGWFWTDFLTGAEKRFTASTVGARVGTPATLKVRLYGHKQAETVSGGNYAGNMSWNSVSLGDTNFTWSDAGNNTRPFDVVHTRTDLATGGIDTLTVTMLSQTGLYDRQVFLAWFDLSYRRSYDALGEKVFDFTSPAQRGRIHYDIAGFGGTDPMLLDITDIFDTKLVSGAVLDGGTLSFERDEASNRRYTLADETVFLSPVAIERFVVDDLRDTSIQAEYLIVAPDELLGSTLDRLRTHRSAEFASKIVPLSQISAQFGWGIRQPTAIRDFLSYAVYNWDHGLGPGQGIVPEYVLLVGDATRDYRGYNQTSNKTLMPAYYNVPSTGLKLNTFATDDFYVFVEPDSSEFPVLAIGRLPVDTRTELRTVVDKIVDYEADPELGPWRTRIAFVADDEMKGCSSRELNSPCFDRAFLEQHTLDVEASASQVPDVFQRSKIYLTEYPFGNESEKPAAKRAYLDLLRRGVLVSHYSGHGGFDKMADENVFSDSDADATRIGNGKRLYIFSAYSCSIGTFDLPDGSSIAEKLLLSAGGGSIASIASDAPAFATSSTIFARNVSGDLFKPPGSAFGRVGDAVQFAKMRPEQIGSPINDRKYMHLGDPALRLAIPTLKVEVDEHPGFVGGSFETVSGSVLDEGETAAWFNGTATITVAGVADTSGYTFLDHNGFQRRAPYSLEGGSLYRGEIPVSAGRWQASFFVPTDIRQGPLALIRVYVNNGSIDGLGSRDSIPAQRAIELPPDVLNDNEGPEMLITLDGRPHRPQMSVVTGTELSMRLSDPHGINIQGEDDFYAISVTFDEATANERTVDLTERFEYDPGDFRAGGLSTTLESIAPTVFEVGLHTLTIQAADNINNRTKLVLEVELVAEGGEFQVFDPMNFPNPFSDQTQIRYSLSEAADQVTVKIFTVNGRFIREFRDAEGAIGNTNVVMWNGRDQDGDPVANGVYFFKIVASATDGTSSEAIGKAVVLRR